MGISIKVRTEGFDQIPEKVKSSCTKASHTLAIQVAKDTSPFVPFLTGSLDARTKVEDETITYPGPYAQYLYYGKLMVDPSTGSAWASKGESKTLTSKNLVFSKSGHSQAQDHWFEASKAQNKDEWEKVAERAVKDEL